MLPATEYLPRWRGRVISAEQPDILVIVEVESRPTLKRFCEQVLRTEFKFDLPYFMVIDGNDDRGIDGSPADSHPRDAVARHDPDPGALLAFSWDCPEYDIELPGSGTGNAGARAQLRPPPAALAGRASDALSFGCAAGGVADSASGGTGRGGGDEKVARIPYVPFSGGAFPPRDRPETAGRDGT
jgi:hypothetical protein